MFIGEPSGIEHVATGGTIDAVWSPEDDTAVLTHNCTSAEYLTFLADRLGFPKVPSEVLMLKDSRQITTGDKKLIAQRVAESAVTRTIVTSGTYLMTEIGERILHHPLMTNNRFGHRVAMVSALTPIRGFEMSDGGFGLGMAKAALEDPRIKDPVLGVVNGTFAPIDKLEKDLTRAVFENIDTGDSLLGYSSYTLIPAGGTIDFVPDGLDGVEASATSFIPTYLRRQVRSTIEFDATPPILKDSRHLTREDMDLVVDLAREAPSQFIIVTAGLLRIAALRERLAEGLSSPNDRDRRVIVAGSRFMLSSVGMTDAPFTLGYAHGKLGGVAPGVHVAVTGRILSPDQDPLEFCYTPKELEVVATA